MEGLEKKKKKSVLSRKQIPAPYLINIGRVKKRIKK
jgi:hypothetical protein